MEARVTPSVCTATEGKPVPVRRRASVRVMSTKPTELKVKST
jgi:hypothetical protein